MWKDARQIYVQTNVKIRDSANLHIGWISTVAYYKFSRTRYAQNFSRVSIKNRGEVWKAARKIYVHTNVKITRQWKSTFTEYA